MTVNEQRPTRPRHRLIAGTAVSCLTVGLMTWPARTQDASIPPSIRRELEIRDRQLAEQRETIRSLSERLTLLESQLQALASAAGSGAPAVAAAQVPAPRPSATARTTTVTGQAAAAPKPPPSRPGAEPEPPPAVAPAAAPAPARPGVAPFEVAPEEIERALERTLTAQGALLIPFGQMEVDPSFAYVRRESTNAGLVAVDGTNFIGDNKIERDEFLGALDLRVGLPYDSQVELGLPYEVVREERVGEAGFLVRDSNSETGAGFRNLSLGLAKTILGDGPWRPDLIGRVIWEPSTGQNEDDGVGLQAGGQSLSATLSAVKVQDPLAFVGSLGYTFNSEKNDVRPGNEFFLSFGSVLGISPETSARVQLTQQFVDDIRLDGERVSGSDQNSATLTIGASTFLFRGALLDVAAGIGVTDDAPDYSIMVSLPIRFNLPTF
jgi:hypothetical protein